MALIGRAARAVAAVLALAAVAAGALMLVARPAAPHPYFAAFARYPLVIAHADDTGQGLWPGNTMAFLEGAAGLGVDVLEMDAHMTADGHVVLMHDATVDRTTDGAGPVWEHTLAEIRALEVAGDWSPDGGATFPYRGRGLRVPTIDEVFARFPGYPMVVEIKQEAPPMGAQLCAAIRRHAMADRVIVPSFSDSALAEFRAACPEVATAASSGEARGFVLLSYAYLADTLSPGYQALQVPERSSGIEVVTPRSVRAAHARGLQVHVWTVNDPAAMRRLLDMGVDGIMTDRPDLLLGLLGR